MKNKKEIIDAVRMLTHTAIEFVYENTNNTMEEFGEKIDDLCGQQEHILLLLADNSELEPNIKTRDFLKQAEQTTNNITVEFIVDPRSYEATREPIKTYKSTNHFNNKSITVITDTTDNILKLIQKLQYYYYFKKLDEQNNSGAEFAPYLENTKNGRLFVCSDKEVEKLKQLVLSTNPNTRIEIEHYCMETLRETEQKNDRDK